MISLQGRRTLKAKPTCSTTVAPVGCAFGAASTPAGLGLSASQPAGSGSQHARMTCNLHASTCTYAKQHVSSASD